MAEEGYIKPKLLILEGADKVGKSTIYQAFRRATAYQPFVIDRLIGSNISYDELYSRKHLPGDPYSTPNLKVAEQKLQSVFDIYLIVLSGQKSILRKRIGDMETGEDLKLALANFEKANAFFLGYLRNSNFKHKRLIITTDKSVDKCVDEILEFMGEERRDDPGRPPPEEV